jgi:hypothetical protein
VDDALRDLERRWRATGAPGDEAAWARERARAGRLAPWRLELAARCGHPGLGGVESPPLAFGEWLAALPFAARHGGARKEWARAALAAASALEPVGLRLGAGPEHAELLAHATRQYLEPAPDHLARLEAARRASAWGHYELHPDRWEPISPAAAFACLAAEAADMVLGERADPIRIATWAGVLLEPAPPWSLEPGVDAAIEADFPRADGRLWRLRERIAAELLAWALEREDPLRARLAEARA